MQDETQTGGMMANDGDTQVAPNAGGDMNGAVQSDDMAANPLGSDRQADTVDLNSMAETPMDPVPPEPMADPMMTPENTEMPADPPPGDDASLADVANSLT